MANPTNTTAAMAARIAELEAALAAKQRLTFKVNAIKDGKDEPTVSVYGLQRFPVSLYPGQWERLITPESLKSLAVAIAEARRK